jgi:hypothetical protein
LLLGVFALTAISGLKHGATTRVPNAKIILASPAAAAKLDTTEPDAVALLTRLTGKILVKEPQRIFPALTWTALDVGGPCVEAFGMISENSSPLWQGRSVT